MKTMFDSVDALERSMTMQRERHNVIAKNLANLDTPGYKPLDLVDGKIVEDESEPAGIDGNAVSLEKELAKIDANRVRYATSTELVSRKLALLRYTSGDGSP